MTHICEHVYAEHISKMLIYNLSHLVFCNAVLAGRDCSLITHLYGHIYFLTVLGYGYEKWLNQDPTIYLDHIHIGGLSYVSLVTTEMSID